MAEDFGYCWRTVRLYCPSAPTFLAREWVQSAWKQLVAARRWGFLRAEVSLPIADTDTVLVLPADFASFRVVVDPVRQVRIRTLDALDALVAHDPSLGATGPLTALIATGPSTTPLTLGRAQVRLYPSGTASTLTLVYNTLAPRLIDGQVFPPVLSDNAETLVTGALAQAALWPGTGDKPNPYFNAGLAQTKAAEFKYQIQMLSLRDDELYPDDLWESWTYADCGVAAGDPRSTDACSC